MSEQKVSDTDLRKAKKLIETSFAQAKALSEKLRSKHPQSIFKGQAVNSGKETHNAVEDLDVNETHEQCAKSAQSAILSIGKVVQNIFRSTDLKCSVDVDYQVTIFAFQTQQAFTMEFDEAVQEGTVEDDRGSFSNQPPKKKLHNPFLKYANDPNKLKAVLEKVRARSDKMMHAQGKPISNKRPKNGEENSKEKYSASMVEFLTFGADTVTTKESTVMNHVTDAGIPTPVEIPTDAIDSSTALENPVAVETVETVETPVVAEVTKTEDEIDDMKEERRAKRKRLLKVQQKFLYILKKVHYLKLSCLKNEYHKLHDALVKELHKKQTNALSSFKTFDQLSQSIKLFFDHIIAGIKPLLHTLLLLITKGAEALVTFAANLFSKMSQTQSLNFNFLNILGVSLTFTISCDPSSLLRKIMLRKFIGMGLGADDKKDPEEDYVSIADRQAVKMLNGELLRLARRAENRLTKSSKTGWILKDSRNLKHYFKSVRKQKRFLVLCSNQDESLLGKKAFPTLSPIQSASQSRNLLKSLEKASNVIFYLGYYETATSFEPKKEPIEILPTMRCVSIGDTGFMLIDDMNLKEADIEKQIEYYRLTVMNSTSVEESSSGKGWQTILRCWPIDRDDEDHVLNTDIGKETKEWIKAVNSAVIETRRLFLLANDASFDPEK